MLRMYKYKEKEKVKNDINVPGCHGVGHLQSQHEGPKP